jgi:SnoaL-like protein
VRQNWAEIFAGVQDFHADLLRSAQEGDSEWAEWHWHGTRADGTRLEMRGVTIFGVREDRIAWGRLYLEEVEVAGQGIEQAVQQMAGESGEAPTARPADMTSTPNSGTQEELRLRPRLRSVPVV